MTGSNDTWYMIAAIVGLTLVTVATRSSFFVLPARFNLPKRVERTLRYAPGCALMAIVAPSIFVRHGHVNVHLNNYQFWAVLAAGIVFAFKRNMMLMMAVGMLAFTALRLYA